MSAEQNAISPEVLRRIAQERSSIALSPPKARRAGLRSAALRADATESAVCGYLALIALAGPAVNAVWNVRRADPIAALVLMPLIVREGWEALTDKPCCD